MMTHAFLGGYGRPTYIVMAYIVMAYMRRWVGPANLCSYGLCSYGLYKAVGRAGQRWVSIYSVKGNFVKGYRVRGHVQREDRTHYSNEWHGSNRASHGSDQRGCAVHHSASIDRTAAAHHSASIDCTSCRNPSSLLSSLSP